MDKGGKKRVPRPHAGRLRFPVYIAVSHLFRLSYSGRIVRSNVEVVGQLTSLTSSGTWSR